MPWDDKINLTPQDGALPLVAQRLSDRLADALIEQIKSGHWATGARLPTEAQLSLHHGVSRSVVREAVQRVKSRGLLLSRQGSGVYVAPAPLHQPLAFDPSVLDSMDAVIQVVELRRALEGEMAALAAERSTRTQQAGLRRALRAVDTATAAGRDGVNEDLAFHRAIAEASGNPHFGRMLAFLEQYLREAMRVTKANESRHEEFMREVAQEHQALVTAISERDVNAARSAAIAHLRNGEQRLVKGGLISQRKTTAQSARSTPRASTSAGAAVPVAGRLSPAPAPAPRRKLSR